MRIGRFAFAALFVCTASLSPSTMCLGQEEKIKLADVPAVVRQAAAKASPGAKWTEASKETDEGKTIYTLVGKTAKDLELEVQVSAAGKVLEIDLEMELADVPPVVTKACALKYPKFMPVDAESVSRDGKLVAYDLIGKLENKEVEIRVSPDGKSVMIQEDDDD